MTQRIGLAKTLLRPRGVIWTNGLRPDPYARIMRETIVRLRDLGKTIMLSSHILPELAGICDLIGIIEKGRLLALGTVAEVTRKVQENLKITVVIDSDPEPARKLCEQFPGTSNIEVTANEIHFIYTGPRGDLPDLLPSLTKNEVRVMEFREDHADLEQVFLSVTHQKA